MQEIAKFYIGLKINELVRKNNKRKREERAYRHVCLPTLKEQEVLLLGSNHLL